MFLWRAAVQGNPDRLIHGTDYEGNICGHNNTGPKVYYPRITEDLVNFALSGSVNVLSVCVALVYVYDAAAMRSVVVCTCADLVVWHLLGSLPCCW
jgi:hypothetical protein